MVNWLGNSIWFIKHTFANYNAKKLQEYSEEEVSEQSNYQGFLVENINGIFGIKMAGVENIVLNQWEVLFSNVLKAFKKKNILRIPFML